MNDRKEIKTRIHEMECGEPYFSMIFTGEKTIEGRRAMKRWKEIKVGDTIRFSCCKMEPFLAQVTKIDTYKGKDCLETFLKTHIKQALPNVKTIEEGIEIYKQWSTPKQLESDGFLAIHVKKL